MCHEDSEPRLDELKMDHRKLDEQRDDSAGAREGQRLSLPVSPAVPERTTPATPIAPAYSTSIGTHWPMSQMSGAQHCDELVQAPHMPFTQAWLPQS
jgi:hypothetical protein